MFLIGLGVLTACSKWETKNRGKLKDLKMLERYGRRKRDATATLPFVLGGMALTFLGSGLALVGLCLFIATSL